MGSLLPSTTVDDNVPNKYTVDGIEVTETTLTEEKAKGFQINGKYSLTISHSGHTTGESDVSRLV